MTTEVSFTRRRLGGAAGTAGTAGVAKTLAGGGALAAALTRCTPGASPPGDIVLGQITAVSGPFAASAGAATLSGAAMAVDEANKAGGWDLRGQKRKVVLLREDDQHKPEAAVAAALKLINQDHVTALLGPPLSANALPVTEAAEKARVPLLLAGGTAPALTEGKRYVFRVIYSDVFQGSTLARFARQDLGATRAATLYDASNAFGRDVTEAFRRTFETAGGRVVTAETYVTGERDFARQLGRIKDAGADALFLPQFDPDVGLQVEQAQRLGLKVAFLGPDSWSLLAGETRKTLPGAYYVQPWSADTPDERGQAFVRAYKERFGSEPRFAAATSYDAVGLILEAIKRRARTDSESIRTDLAAITRYAGASGVLGYNGSGDPVRSAVIMQIIGDQARFFRQINP